MVSAMPWSLPAWLARPAELRIDVSERPDRPPEDTFASLHERMNTPGDRLHGLPSVALNDPRFVIRHRQADGEYYVYVEDIQRRRLAGHTVFNRLVELDKRADRHLRAPHSRYGPDYQRRGLASAVYRWGLDAGLCLITGARQSPGAHALWLALARRYELGYVDLRDRTLSYLGREVRPGVLDDLHTRMILLGKDWTIGRLRAAAGMR